MYNPESILKNETYKVLWDFEIKTDHLISARQQDNKKKKSLCWTVDFAVPVDYKVKFKESKKIDKYQDIPKELKKKAMKHDCDSDNNCKWCTQNNPWRIGKGAERLGKKRILKTIQSIALLRSTRKLRRVLAIWGDLLSLRLHWKTISWCWCEKLSPHTEEMHSRIQVDHRKRSITKCTKDDIKLFAKNEKELETLKHAVRVYRNKNGIWHRKMCHASNEKRQTTSNWQNGTTKSTLD